MTGKVIDLEFDGYWREVNKSGVPAQSGIYCVYTCTPKKVNDEIKLTIHELIYIGESSNVQTRLDTHERLGDWKQHLKSGDTLCYSVALVTPADRVRAEAALIHEVQPPENSEYSGEYKGLKTTINTSGYNKSLPENFTIEPE